MSDRLCRCGVAIIADDSPGVLHHLANGDDPNNASDIDFDLDRDHAPVPDDEDA